MSRGLARMGFGQWLVRVQRTLTRGWGLTDAEAASSIVKHRRALVEAHGDGALTADVAGALMRADHPTLARHFEQRQPWAKKPNPVEGQSAVGQFVTEHPWMTFFLGLVGISALVTIVRGR